MKSTGDGMLIEFANARDAVECAVEFRSRAREGSSGPGARRLSVRIGIHPGDVEERGTDIPGDAVNIAARAEPLAGPGGIALSEPVYVKVRDTVPYSVDPLGPKSLKGGADPSAIYRVTVPWADSRYPTRTSATPRLAVLPQAFRSLALRQPGVGLAPRP